MKSIAGTLRLDLAQYREMAAFAQFASDLDAKTKALLERGARLVEILKQGQYVPLPVEKQILIIYAATQGYVDSYSVGVLGRYEQELYKYVEAKHPQVLTEILEKKVLDDDLKAKLKKALDGFKKRFVLDEQKAVADAEPAAAPDEEAEEEEAEEARPRPKKASSSARSKKV
jgi:F-type H+-transporting ATPase subunit alpha